MPILKTARLILREYKASDWKAINAYSSKPKVVKYMPFGPSTIKDTKKFVSEVLKENKKKKRTFYEFAVTLKSTKKMIGSCRVGITDRKNREGSLGYILHPDYWNKGYMTEAAKKMLEYGFKDLKLHRIFARCRPENKASAKVMKKINMHYEGNLRKQTFEKGEWKDSLIFAILEDEFNK